MDKQRFMTYDIFVIDKYGDKFVATDIHQEMLEDGRLIDVEDDSYEVSLTHQEMVPDDLDIGDVVGKYPSDYTGEPDNAITEDGATQYCWFSIKARCNAAWWANNYTKIN